MKRHHETEIKLQVRDRRALKRRLAASGFRVIQPRHFESNALYDFQDLRLWKAHCLLRLRQEGERWLVTFKGTPLESPDYKIRREIETVVKDGPALRGVLEALGLHEAFRYEKYRTAYSPTAGPQRGVPRLLLFDETPIGDYLELEGPKRWIDKVASGLGYRRQEYITASYSALYRQKCQERGEKPANMVFQKS